MTALFLSRARLKRDVPAIALARVLIPDDANARTDVSHRLVWALFADAPDRERDFLWREEQAGGFMLLSARPPEDPHGLFDLDTKPFDPQLRAGDRLRFTLRANPVVARKAEPGARGKRHDVVMDLLRHTAPGQRADIRTDRAAEAGRAWLARQGEMYGFHPNGDASIEGYLRVRVPRPSGAPAIFGRLDISGELEVRDPHAFASRIGVGFGRSRAFGCGLMLIRRSR